MRATTLLNRVLTLPKTTVRAVEFGEEVTVWVFGGIPVEQHGLAVRR